MESLALDRMASVWADSIASLICSLSVVIVPAFLAFIVNKTGEML